MDLLLGAGGILLVFIVIVDLLWTTLWVDGGAGPVTRALGETLWSGFRAVGGVKSGLLSTGGPVILVFTLLAWIAMLWLGWTMIFAADTSAVVSASTQVPADLTGRFYFVGYSIFTMGNGDYKPNGASWQVLTGIAAGTGLLLVTLAITYLLSVVSAVVTARAFAVQVMGLGSSADDAVAAGWNGTSLSGLNWPFQSANSALSSLSQQYLAYPVLRYFHASQPSSSDVLALYRLEQMVLIARSAVAKDQRPDSVLLNGLRSSLDSVLSSLPWRLQAKKDANVSAPSLEALKAAGIPTVEATEFAKACEKSTASLGAFAALVREHGWDPRRGSKA